MTPEWTRLRLHQMADFVCNTHIDCICEDDNAMLLVVEQVAQITKKMRHPIRVRSDDAKKHLQLRHERCHPINTAI